MTRLTQILAVEKGVRKSAYERVTELHRQTQTPALLSGIARSYTPREDPSSDVSAEALPSESTKVQVTVDAILKDLAKELSRLIDVTATKDYANTAAKADVIVDGTVLLAGAPVTFLLFLEKQLIDIHTFIKKLPVLDPSENWGWDKNQGCSASPEVETTRTKKIPKAFVKYQATKEHPAQVDVWHEDVIVGKWTTRRFSGALEKPRKDELLERVEKLQRAVKFAREEANQVEVTDVPASSALFEYLFL